MLFGVFCFVLVWFVSVFLAFVLEDMNCVSREHKVQITRLLVGNLGSESQVFEQLE